MGTSVSEEIGTIELPSGTLNLEFTLTNGQIFRWRKLEGEWWDVVSGANLIRVRSLASEGETERFEYQTFPQPMDRDLFDTFFRLDVDLDSIYQQWRAADAHLGSLCSRFAGLRLVKQIPDECLLSFICSTANFIPRIMKAVAIIARKWGEPITTSGGKVLTHSLPNARVLAEVDIVELAVETGLEWRGANLIKVAKQLAQRPSGWLDELALLDYASARGELMRLDGVGPKIADCVALFAWRKDQAVPVDTHVWQLTREHYLPALRGKSLTPAAYAQILQFYQARFEKAGWAQQYLFFDHLLESRAKRKRD